MKWLGTFGCGLILGLWAISIAAPFCYNWAFRAAVVWEGKLVFTWYTVSFPNLGWQSLPRVLPWGMIASYGFDWPILDLTRTYIVLPFWLLLLVALIPTAILWYRDCRIPVGHCQKCGYNLTGNVSGRCPECGTDLRPAGDAPAAQIGTARRESGTT